MIRQTKRARAEQGYIVDLKSKKQLLLNDVKSFEQPQEKIPAILKTIPNYREGSHNDILNLLKEEKKIGDEGVFLKGKIPPPYGINLEINLTNGGFSKSICHYQDRVNPSNSYVRKVVRSEKFNPYEVIHMCQLDDMNICKLFGVVRKTTEYDIYMEYCGHNLYVLARSVQFIFDQIVDISEQLCMAVEFAHNKQILHLDIKPQNICVLFTKNGILLKLTDWGSSKRDNSSTEINSFTFNYASPELLYFYISQKMYWGQFNQEMVNKTIQLTQKYCKNYNNIDTISSKADSFSIGLTIMFVFKKRHLYANQQFFTNAFSLCQMFAENPDTAKNLVPVHGDFITDMVKKLIEGDSHKRCSMQEIQKMITEYRKSLTKNRDLNSEVIEDTSQMDTILVPENQDFNLPNLDLLI